jgi:serine/threonine protein kinase/Tfp pilus assembly protein PilF
MSGGISRFEISERLGEGGMGVVYRARDSFLKRHVALKRIKPGLAEDHEVRARFLRECRAAAAINHPNVATIYEAGESEDGSIYLASELIRGESLVRRLRRGRITNDEQLDLGIQLTQGLAAAHEAGVVHRDIKPGNVMVTDDGRVKILDFGLARLNQPLGRQTDDDGDTLTRTRPGHFLGTPAYMSPEQVTGTEVEAASDVFSCGCVLYEMASGKAPFSADSVSETVRRILSADPPDLDALTEDAPEGLVDIIATALAKNPADRFADASEMAHALVAVRDRTAPTALQEPATSATRGRRVGMGLAATAVIIAAALLSWVFGRSTLAFEKKDQLLITSVVNQTNEEAFDLALRTALEADLQQSPYVSVFQQSQAAAVLNLMRLDPSSPINEPLGRDICRFAGVRAMLMPRILAVGDAYELQAILVDPVSGRHVDRIRVTARGREQVLLTAIDELTREVRKRLGESLESIDEADIPVVTVATSSWEALKYLAMARTAWWAGQFEEATGLFELALEKDSRFASAKRMLALVLIQFKGEKERGKQLLREALVDAEGLPEHEYLMIRAANKQFVDEDPEAALAEYELIRELYPDSVPAHNNSGHILLALGRTREALPVFERAAELDVTVTPPLISLYFVHLDYFRDAAKATEAARRLVERAPQSVSFRVMLAWSLAAEGVLDEALELTRAAVDEDPHHAYGLPNLAHLLYASGADDEAAIHYRTIYDLIIDGKLQGDRLAAARDLVVALVSAGASDEALQLAEGEASIILEHMEGARSDAERHLELSQLRAVMGSDTRAREHVERAKRLGVNEPGSILAMAQAHALLGDYESALTEVALALDEGYSDPFMPLYLPSLRPLRSDSRFLALFAPPAEAIEIEADRDYATGKLAGEDAEEETGGSADEWWKKK